MEIDFLDAAKAERDEQRRRYLIAVGEAIALGNLADAQQGEFDRIEKKIRELTAKCREKETAIEGLRTQDHEEYVSQMVELCDEEAKAYSILTGELRRLVQEVRLRRGTGR